MTARAPTSNFERDDLEEEKIPQSARNITEVDELA